MSHPSARPLVACSLLFGLFLVGCTESNDPPPAPTLVAVFEGVLGGEDGAESGTFEISFMSDNSGSGTFTPTGGVAQALNNVLVNGSSFTASGGGVSLSGTFTADDLSGSYTKASGDGLVAALKRVTGATYTKYCASHNGDQGAGVYNFVWNPATHKLHGLWTTVGGAFQGIISGEDEVGSGAGATMAGNTGTVTILPDVGPPATLGGFYQLASSTINGGMSGTSCP